MQANGIGSGNLRILTLNAGLFRVKLGPWHIEPVPHVELRANALARSLVAVGAHIVTVQEICEHAHRNRVIMSVSSQYPHVARVDTHGTVSVGNGLLTLSRFPIRTSHFEPFAHATLGERRYLQKGILTSVIDVPDVGPIAVYNVHTTSGGALRHPESPVVNTLRKCAIEHLVRLYQCTALPAIVAGDLNAGPEADPESYHILLAHGFVDAYGSVTPPWATRVTWDPANLLNVDGPHRRSPPQRIDHVFLCPRLAASHAVADARVVLHEPHVRVRGGHVVTNSDHSGVVAYLRRIPGAIAVKAFAVS